MTNITLLELRKLAKNYDSETIFDACKFAADTIHTWLMQADDAAGIRLWARTNMLYEWLILGKDRRETWRKYNHYIGEYLPLYACSEVRNIRVTIAEYLLSR